MSGWLKLIIVGKSPRRTFLRAAILGVVCLLVFKFLLLPARVMSDSMEPSYRRGSIRFVNLLVYRFRTPRRGEVVAIKMAGRSVLLLKRIVGLPGEQVAFQRGKLMINGRPFSEPYVRSDCDWNLSEIRAGADEYFVVGDNRQMSIEEHLFGRVKRERIIGVVWF